MWIFTGKDGIGVWILECIHLTQELGRGGEDGPGQAPRSVRMSVCMENKRVSKRSPWVHRRGRHRLGKAEACWPRLLAVREQGNVPSIVTAPLQG